MLLTGSGLCYVRSNVYHYGIYNTSSDAPREQLNKNQALAPLRLLDRDLVLGRYESVD